MGGKNAVMIMEDADLDLAVEGVLWGAFGTSGQRCTAASRVIVHKKVAKRFTARLVEATKQLKLGNGLSDRTDVGPVINQDAVNKILGYIEIGQREDKAKLLCGGNRVERSDLKYGNFIEPTVFGGVKPEMRIAQEEIFGPVLTMIPFADEAEALSIANDVRYGLAAYLWTGDVGRAHRFAQAVEAGMVWVNSENVRHLPTPFGGTKSSGIGRDGGDYSFDFYMETKNIAIALDNHKIPKIGA